MNEFSSTKPLCANSFYCCVFMLLSGAQCELLNTMNTQQQQNLGRNFSIQNYWHYLKHVKFLNTKWGNLWHLFSLIHWSEDSSARMFVRSVHMFVHLFVLELCYTCATHSYTVTFLGTWIALFVWLLRFLFCAWVTWVSLSSIDHIVLVIWSMYCEIVTNEGFLWKLWHVSLLSSSDHPHCSESFSIFLFSSHSHDGRTDVFLIPVFESV